MNALQTGLYNKFSVSRVDGGDAPGEKHHGCDYFVLDLTHDKHAIPALAAYAVSCAATYPQLAAELRAKVVGALADANVFVTVPAVTLPDGTVVDSFQVGKYLTTEGPLSTPQINADGKPWVEINYREAREAARAAGLYLITERQWLAIAHDIANQDVNWSGGKVGEGKIFQGLRRDTLDAAVGAAIESQDPSERRWHQLSNGEIVFDFAGNAFSWIFDDVQGDAEGVVAKTITTDSLSRTVAMAAGAADWRKKGLGWQPEGDARWSGYALIRGGFFYSGVYAGVFNLDYGSPGRRDDYVGFRCTK